MSYYECHITMKGNPVVLKPQVEVSGWKFSAIDGDIDLGDGVKCYATMHYPARNMAEEVIATVKGYAGAYKFLGIDVLRSKVELVIYDSKQDKDKPR